MIKMYLFLKKNRLRKKRSIYKQIWMLSKDVTVFIYVAAALGYILTVFVLEGNFFENIKQLLPTLEVIDVKRFSYIFMGVPLIYIIKSFGQPGVLFTKTEWKLTTLPYKANNIWFVLALERWLKAGFIFCSIGLVYYLLSDTSGLVILLYISILLLLNIWMTIIEWKLFQQNIWIKLGTLLAGINMIGLYILFPSNYIVYAMIILLMSLQFIGYRRLVSQIDWEKVTMAADYKVWNLPLVSHVTKVSFKKERKFSLWQQRTFWKKPFSFQKNTLYHRLWQIYFGKNMKYILQISGALLLMNLVLGLFKPWLFLVALLITVHIWSSLMAVMYRDRFSVDIVEVLPWDLERYKHSFLIWAYGQTCILLLPLFIYMYFQPSYWNVLLLFVIVSAFLILLHEKVNKEMHLISNAFPYNKEADALAYISLFCVLASFVWKGSLFIAVILLGGTIVWKIWERKKVTQKGYHA